MATSHANPTVDSILAECREAVAKGLGKKRLSRKASDYWETEHRSAIERELERGGDWHRDRKKALPVARKLGKVAAALTDRTIVLFWAAKAAHMAVRADTQCSRNGMRGGYCDF